MPEFPTARPPGRISTEQPAKEPTEGLHGFPTAIPTGIPGEESEPIEPSEGTGKTGKLLRIFSHSSLIHFMIFLSSSTNR